MRYFISLFVGRLGLGRLLYKCDRGSVFAKFEFNDDNWLFISINIEDLEKKVREGRVREVEPAEAALLF